LFPRRMKERQIHCEKWGRKRKWHTKNKANKQGGALY
jgi:hypothetical protein